MKIWDKIKKQFMSNDIGIDLGTSNILMNVDKRGLVIREPAVVAVDKNTGRVLQVGSAARNMMGRTPGNVVALHPLKDGVISDQEMTVKMLQIFFKRVSESKFLPPKPRVIISVPSGVSEVEERTVINAAIEAGARRVYLIEAPLAAALGAKLEIVKPSGHMVVDIGGGTTDIAVLTMNSVANSASLKVAGNAFDEAIVKYIRAKYNLKIGLSTAEEIKIQIGCVYPRHEDMSKLVRGSDAKTGIPREITVLSSEIFEVLTRRAQRIVEKILSVLEEASPELVGDIGTNGITLTGGGSQLYGMCNYITECTGIPCSIADDPDSCVAFGCGMSIGWINTMTEGTLNIARKKLLRQEQ